MHLIIGSQSGVVDHSFTVDPLQGEFLLCRLLFHRFRRLMVSRGIPTRWHKYNQDLILPPPRAGQIPPQADKFSEIEVPEVTLVDRAGDTILDRDSRLLVLVGAENAVPDIQQIAKIRVHIERIPGMMHPVVGRR